MVKDFTAKHFEVEVEAEVGLNQLVQKQLGYFMPNLATIHLGWLLDPSHLRRYCLTYSILLIKNPKSKKEKSKRN